MGRAKGGNFCRQTFLLRIYHFKFLLEGLNGQVAVYDLLSTSLFKSLRQMMPLPKQESATKIREQARQKTSSTYHALMLQIVTQKLVVVHLFEMMAHPTYTEAKHKQSKKKKTRRGTNSKATTYVLVKTIKSLHPPTYYIERASTCKNNNKMGSGK